MEIRTAIGVNNQVYRDALQLRTEVFIKEQGYRVQDEVDQFDPTAQNYVGYVKQAPVTTARILLEANGVWHIQRVCTKQNHRHQGLASQLLRYLIQSAQEQKVRRLVLNAQLPAQAFYRHLNFQATDKPIFLDAGEPHQEMQLIITTSANAKE